MTEIDVPDWVAEIAAKAYFEDMCSLDHWNDPMDEAEREEWRDGARKILTAALGAWVVPVGVRYRVAPNDACRSRPWVGPGIVAEWNRPPLTDSETLQYQSIYTLRQEKPE